MATIQNIFDASRLGSLYGLKVPVRPVCREHRSPAMMLAQLLYDRPSQSLWQGPRGGGKSMLTALAAHISATTLDGFHAKILGGSFAQSRQIYDAIKVLRDARPELDVFSRVLTDKVEYLDGQTIEILFASDKSVRGPHVPQLFIDEVDEVKEDIFYSAIGMSSAFPGIKASISLTSTWHRVAGLMKKLVEDGRKGMFPVGTFCMFDVLERCPDERSGPDLEGCPTCPIVKWCHSDRDQDPLGRPKAKRSEGHYAIDAFIQKANGVSPLVFESDYLCMKPRAEAMWFRTYDDSEGGPHVTEEAEYRPGVPFHAAADPGVHTGCVWFQVRRHRDGRATVNVFGDHLTEGESAEANALAIRARTEELTGLEIGHGRFSMDPAASSRTSIGPSILGEYERSDCRGRNRSIEQWPPIGPGRPKADVLETVNALLMAADGTVSLTIHPRCRHLRDAFLGYERAKSPDGQLLDRPVDPQHPQENMIDALSGGLTLEFPKGFSPPLHLITVPASRFL